LQRLLIELVMESFKPVIDEYYPILYKIGRSYTRTPADFEDLYQEMLIQVYKSLKKFRGQSKTSTFIYKVALNTAMTFNRNNKKKEQEVCTDDMAGQDHQEDPGGSGQEAEQHIESRQLYYLLVHLNLRAIWGCGYIRVEFLCFFRLQGFLDT